MQRSLTDLIKVIAAIAVVGIHATSQSELRFAQAHAWLSLDFASVIVNQWARFSVPLFIYLSAYGLAKSDKPNSDGFLISAGQFIRKRLPTILVPYLFFSSIALALEFHSYQGTAEALIIAILNKLRTGAADYHLYFLVILAQCYLLFPALMWISRRHTSSYQICTWLSLVLVAGLLYKGSSEMLLPLIGISHPGWHASFFIYWLPYFMLGILHAQRPPGVSDNKVVTESATNYTQSRLFSDLRNIFATAAVGITLAVVLVEYVYYSHQGMPVDYYNHFSRPSVMLYVLTVIWWLRSIPSAPGGRLTGMFSLTSTALSERKTQCNDSNRSLRAVETSGSCGQLDNPGWGEAAAPLTFSVYLIHPQLLRLVNNYLPALPTLFGWILVVVTAFAVVYALALLMNNAKQNSPAWLTGPLSLLQRCLGLR